MKYYLDPETGEIYAYPADGSEDEFIPDGLKLLDEKGLLAARKAQEAANAPTPEQLLEAANAQRDSLLAVAALRIAPLQYAVDLDSATDSERLNLTKWKQYSVDVNRVTDQAKYPQTISWPTPPGE